MKATCGICKDFLTSSNEIFGTQCGHVFHSACIFQWIERSKTCPECRSKINLKNLVRLYLNFENGESSQTNDPEELQNINENLKFQIYLNKQEINLVKEEVEKLKVQNRALREECKSISTKLKTKELVVSTLEEQLKYMDDLSKETKQAKIETNKLKLKMKTMVAIEGIISGCSEDIESSIALYSSLEDGINSLATISSVLKKQLNESVDEKRRLREENTYLRNSAKELKKSSISLEMKMTLLESENSELKNYVASLNAESESLAKKISALESAIISPSDNKKNGIIRRLLAESPAPVSIKDKSDKILSEEVNEAFTPEAVRSYSQQDRPSENIENCNVSSDSPYLQIKSTNLLINSTSNLTSNRFSKSVLSGKSICKNPIASTSGVHSSGDCSGFGYDGFGGHSKIDEFPKPRQRFLLKKRKAISTSSINKKSSIQNFFTLNFDE